MHPHLSDRDGLTLARSYELNRQDVAADALVVETWNQPADELVVWLTRRHGWSGELSVSYLTALKTVCAGRGSTASDPQAAASGYASCDRSPGVERLLPVS
jgi:hypothetical protein